MASVTVHKGDDGKLEGFGEKGMRAWRRFHAMLARLQPGDTLEFQWHEPRSPGFHRRFFKKLHSLFDMQEQFDDPDKLRAWLTVGAGEADFLPGPKGRMVAMPRSIAWHKLDETEFRELAHRVDNFLWSPQAQAFLWPHLDEQRRYQMIEALDMEFSRG